MDTSASMKAAADRTGWSSHALPVPGVCGGSRYTYTGNIPEALRSRELYKYYQPSVKVSYRASKEDLPDDPAAVDVNLVSSEDPALASFVLLTANLLQCKRSFITLVDDELVYIVAESTRSLSLTRPHTHDPGDGLWIGGCETLPREGGLCERTISLVPPEGVDNGAECILIFELEDMAQEPAWKDEHSVKNWPYMRYYAGSPLRTRNGVSIGSLCVIDDKPHPGGLKSEEKRTMAKMAETVMSHLERVRAQNEMKRGKMMELGMSRFVAANFLQTGAGLADARHDGKLRGTGGSILEEKRVGPDRLAWAGAIHSQESQSRDQGQNVKPCLRRQVSNASQCSCMLASPAQDLPRSEESVDPLTPIDQGWPSGGGTNLKTSQLPLSFPTSDREGFGPPDVSFPLRNPAGLLLPGLSRKLSYCSQTTSGLVASAGNSSTVLSSLNATSSSSMSSAGSLHPPTFKVPDYGRNPARAPHGCQDSDDVDNAFRSTFGRASVLIRSSIEADGVAFVDCDLGRNYGFVLDSGNPSSEPPAPSGANRPQRPPTTRRKSGVFGYATASGSSCSSPWDNDHSNSLQGYALGQDASFNTDALSESFLRSLADCCPQGHIFSYSNNPNDGMVDIIPEMAEDLDSDDPLDSEIGTASYPHRSCYSKGSRACRKQVETLKNFLPESRTLVFAPLYDFDGNLFAVGFAWSNSKTRVFSKEIEGSYMVAFGNSIMAEIGRLHSVSADRAKGDFISSVSHELRSPLHGILASAEFLSETDLDSFQRSFVDTVESCGRTLLDTINHVLDFSKLNSFDNRWGGRRPGISMDKQRGLGGWGNTGGESNVTDGDEDGCVGPMDDPSSYSGCDRRLSVRCDGDFVSSVADVDNLTADTDLSAILEEVTEGVFAGYEFRGISTPGILEDVGKVNDFGAGGKLVAGRKNDITVIMDIDRREDGWIFQTQPGALRRIFLNLGGNAIKYTDSGWVKIKLKAEDLPISCPGGEERSLVTLVFTDSGKGISREFLKTKLFTPFSQENPLVSGTGLGMSIVRQIVEMLGGEIDVRSEVGHGTEVTVSLVLKKSKRGDMLQSDGSDGMGVHDWNTEIEAIRGKTEGKRVRLTGFNGSPRGDLQATAISYLEGSFERYITQWFGMTPVAQCSSDSQYVDFVIAHDGPAIKEHLSRRGKGLPGKEGGAPLIVICSNASRHETYQSLSGIDNKGIVDFVSKPCGPRKLARALASCIGKIKTTTPKQNGIATTETKSSTGCSRRGSAGSTGKSPDFLKTVCKSSSTSPVPKPLSPPRRGTFGPGALQHVLSPLSRSVALPTALIVEDNPVNLMLLATFMTKKGYPFEKATNGLEALRAAEGRPGGFDIILMDLQMPVMSGIESTRAIRNLEKQSRAKGSLIIALTGLAAASDKVEAYEAGIDLFMVKPVSFKQLEKTMKKFTLLEGAVR